MLQSFYQCFWLKITDLPVLYTYASSSLLGCHIGTGPISAVSWYWVSILWSWTGFRLGCSLDNTRQLNCRERGKMRLKSNDQGWWVSGGKCRWLCCARQHLSTSHRFQKIHSVWCMCKTEEVMHDHSYFSTLLCVIKNSVDCLEVIIIGVFFLIVVNI